MKNARPFLYLLLTLAVASIVFLAERPQESRVSDLSEEAFFPGFDPARVARIEIGQLTSRTTIARDGDGWRVSAAAAREAPRRRADGGRVERALAALADLERGMLVSQNPAHHALYQVDAAGLSLRLFDAKEKLLLDAVVGKSGPDFTNTYLRRADDDRVFLVACPLAWLFSPEAGDWRDRTIWSLDPARITSIEVSSGAQSYRLDRGVDGAWRSVPAGAVDIGEIPSLLARVAELRAQAFPEDDARAAAALEKPSARVVVALEGGKALALALAAPDANGRSPARLEGAPEIVLLSGEVVSTLANGKTPAAEGAPSR